MLILASASPRRKMLLESAGLSMSVEVADIDETHALNENPKDYVMRMAKEKAKAVALAHRGEPHHVIAADTIVVRNQCILGKPASTSEASEMLHALSDNVHSVMTAVCIIDLQNDNVRHFVTETRVVFTKLTDKQIQRYIETGEPMDKAGAYGIQSGAAGFVRRIEGSYTNVVGLPLCETLEALEVLGGLP